MERDATGKKGNRDAFQSLIGFKINWNFIEKVEEGFTGEFQSLIGFKINWNSRKLKSPFIKSSFNP
ncbi:hypothetical protein C789_1562 [Microcystis aeruginosa FACHB-905 = DIANCHI905]|nr:hypothetical protein C789_1562 [Microcystis aeruginosa FACHB-905 = DIANCHI905]